MKLIVGLGNPGKEYEGTRHNAGFKMLDMLAEDCKVNSFRSGFNGLYAKATLEGEDFYLLKPQTYMNLSGTCVKPFADYYKIPVSEIVVLSDDMALEPGRFRMRPSGSSGGQKGLKNIIDNFNTQEIKRIRIGIGEPDENVVDYVLGVPSKDDQVKMEEAMEAALMGLKYYIITGDFSKAMSRFNSNKVQ